MRKILSCLLFCCVLVNAGEKADPIAAKKYYDVASKMLGEGLKDDAITYLTKSIDADPTYREALVLRGHILLQLDKYEEAFKDYDACLKEFKKIDRKLVKYEEDMFKEARDGYALTDRVGTAFREAQEKLLSAAETVGDKKSASLLREAAARVREVAEKTEKKTEMKAEVKKEEKKTESPVGKWIINDKTYQILPNNTVQCSDGNKGIWKLKSANTYSIMWSTGWYDEFDLLKMSITFFDKNTAKVVQTHPIKRLD